MRSNSGTSIASFSPFFAGFSTFAANFNPMVAALGTSTANFVQVLVVDSAALASSFERLLRCSV